MHRTILIATALICLAFAGTAAAAQAPTLAAPTILKAGQTTPVDVAGNRLHHGQTIRPGTQLLRWKATMHGASNASVTLTCPAGTRHVGLASNDRPRIAFALAKGAAYYHRTITVRFYSARKGIDLNGASSHVYALCRG